MPIFLAMIVKLFIERQQKQRQLQERHGNTDLVRQMRSLLPDVCSTWG
jgi:hypothetical protein